MDKVRVELNREAISEILKHPVFVKSVEEYAEKMREEARGSNPYSVDAPWNANGYASERLADLTETPEWLELAFEAAHNTHMTVNEVCDGLAHAVSGYLEGLE